jgi:8-oxo-dGTP pyrophosphatase MutT (NUDIX family)
MNPTRRYFVAGIIARRKKNGKLEFLVMDTKRDGESGSKIKFPGGMEESHDSRNYRRTLRREIRGETGLYIKSEVRPHRFPRILVGDHVRVFYFLWRSNCKGSVRTEPIRDGDSILQPPVWKTLEELEKKLYRSHRPALKVLRDIP